MCQTGVFPRCSLPYSLPHRPTNFRSRFTNPSACLSSDAIMKQPLRYDAPFSADALEKDSSSGEVARQVFWLVPAATPSQSKKNQWLQRVAAVCGTYSSGNCCRFSRHSLFITAGRANRSNDTRGPFVNLCITKLENKFVSLSPQT